MGIKPMKPKRSSAMLGLAFIAGLFALSLSAVTPLSLAPAKHLPTVDGILGEHEYDEGVRFCGLKTVPSDRLSEQADSAVTVLSDGKTLFIAGHLRARNVDFDGGLKSGVLKRDGAVWTDDCVELMLEGDDPNRLAHFVFNPVGTIYDARIVDGETDVRWLCEGLKVSSKVNRGWWELELAIPLRTIGPFTRGFALNVGRKGPGLAAMSLTGAALELKEPRLSFVWSSSAAALQVETLGDPENGSWTPQLKVSAAKDPASRYRVDFFVGERNVDNTWIPRKLESKLLKVGESFAPSFETRSKKDHRLELAVREAKTGEWVYRQELVAKRTSRGGDIPVTAEKDLPGLGGVQVFHYPGLHRARVNVYPASGKEFQKIAVRIGDRTTKLVQNGRCYSALAEVPSASGEHALAIAALTAADEKLKFPSVCTLTTRTWEWEGHSLGLDRVILPPFTPITAQGSTASVIHRQYAFGAAGLPRSITALDRELLAAPIRIEGRVNGRDIVFVGPDGQIEAAADGLEATVVGEAAADGVKIASRSRFEYDGFLYGNFVLSGVAGKTVERLTLVVPLKDAEVPLMHIAMADSIRANPTGKVPAGNGLVWDGTKLNRAAGTGWACYAPQSVPYVWLGAERRGLSWFTDNTCGMELDPRSAAVRLRRTNGVLQLEIDLINQPSRLSDGHSFTFGFEATPVKTADRALAREFQTGELGCPEGMVPRLVVNHMGLGFWNSWARRPYGNDWRTFEAACRHVVEADSPESYVQFFNEGLERNEEEFKAYCANLPKVGTTPHYDWFRGCRMLAMKTVRDSKVKSVPLKYSDPTLCWSEEAEEKHFKSEWVSRPNGYTAASRNFLTKSYMDFSLYYYHKEISLGMTGVYLDDMFPMTCRNSDICGKTDAAGRFHGDFGLLAMRELVKRIAVIQHQAGIRHRLLQVHMTNCLLVPCFAFSTSQLSWEDHYGESEFQKRFKDDYVRAESLGGQIGAEAMALDGIHRRQWPKETWEERFRFLTRTQQAMLLPAGVKLWRRPPWPPRSGVELEELFSILAVPGRFGAWGPDVVFTPHYEYDGSLGPLPEGLHVGRWQRGGKSLYVLGNQTEHDISFKVSTGTLVIPAYDLRFYSQKKGEIK